MGLEGQGSASISRAMLNVCRITSGYKAPISLGCDEFAMGLLIDSKRSHGIAKSSHAS